MRISLGFTSMNVYLFCSKFIHAIHFLFNDKEIFALLHLLVLMQKNVSSLKIDAQMEEESYEKQKDCHLEVKKKLKRRWEF